MEVASFVVNILTLLATVSLTIGIFAVERRQEARHQREKIEAETRLFISSHSEYERGFLPMAVMASGTDEFRKCERTFYNEFNNLDDKVKREVLDKTGFAELPLLCSNSWVDEALGIVSDFINENKLGENMLYDGFKYFHRALDYAKENWDCGYAHSSNFPDPFGWGVIFAGRGLKKSSISFKNYLDSYFYKGVKSRDEEAILYKSQAKPLDLLSTEYNLRGCDEKMVCYWMMEVVDDVASIIIDENRLKDCRIPLFSIEAQNVVTYEDRYFCSLSHLWNMMKILEAKEPKS